MTSEDYVSYVDIAVYDGNADCVYIAKVLTFWITGMEQRTFRTPTAISERNTLLAQAMRTIAVGLDIAHCMYRMDSVDGAGSGDDDKKVYMDRNGHAN